MHFVTCFERPFHPPMYINVQYDGATFLFQTADIMPLLTAKQAHLPTSLTLHDLVLLLYHNGLDNLWIKNATQNIHQIYSSRLKHGPIQLVYPKDGNGCEDINYNKLRGIEYMTN